MATSINIQLFHTDIEKRIVQLTGHRNVRISSPLEDWECVFAPAPISFDMYSHDCHQFAERDMGGRCAVFPLKADFSLEDNQAWVGWHEEWQCQRRNNFDLIGAGWTFFWGVYGRLTKEQQIFRADWDETNHRGGNAPQPHWHLDKRLMIGYTTVPRAGAVRPARSSSLVELPPISDSESALYEISPAEGLQEISLGKMHLGMGGWSNHDKHPEWWQCHVGEDLNALADWAERTLQLAMDQFEKFMVVDKVV